MEGSPADDAEDDPSAQYFTGREGGHGRIPPHILARALGADTRPLPNTTFVLRAMREAGELGLSRIANMTASTSLYQAPPAAADVLVPDVLEVMLPLLRFEDSALLRLKAGQVIEHACRAKHGPPVVRSKGGVGALVHALEHVCGRMMRAPADHGQGELDEPMLRTVLKAMRSLTRDPEGLEDAETTDVAVLLLEIISSASATQASEARGDEDGEEGRRRKEEEASQRSRRRVEKEDAEVSDELLLINADVVLEPANVKSSTTRQTGRRLLSTRQPATGSGEKRPAAGVDGQRKLVPSAMVRALAAGCVAHLCDRRRDYMAYLLCAGGVLTHLIPMIQSSQDELTRLCACAALNRLASCKRTHQFFTLHENVVALLLELFHVTESPHHTHRQVRMLSLWSLVYLLPCTSLRRLMAEQHIVDMVLDTIDNHDLSFQEKVHVSVLMFGLDSLHTQSQVVDVAWTYMRALQMDASLAPTWPTSLFLGYLLTHVQDNDGQQAGELMKPLSEYNGVAMLACLLGDLTLPLLMRENAWKVLLLLSEDYCNYPRFLEFGLLPLCCEYQQPHMDSSELLLSIVRTIMQGMVIYDCTLVAGFVSVNYPNLLRTLTRRMPEADDLLVRLKENRREFLLEQGVRDVMDGDMRGQISKAEVRAIKDIFIRFDADCSATIDTDELRRVFESLNIHLNFIQLRAVMSAADSDKSGSIELPEFVRVLCDYRQGKITGLGYIKEVIKEEVEKTVATVRSAMDKTMNMKTQKMFGFETDRPDSTKGRRATSRRPLNTMAIGDSRSSLSRTQAGLKHTSARVLMRSITQDARLALTRIDEGAVQEGVTVQEQREEAEALGFGRTTRGARAAFVATSGAARASALGALGAKKFNPTLRSSSSRLSDTGVGQWGNEDAASPLRTDTVRLSRDHNLTRKTTVGFVGEDSFEGQASTEAPRRMGSCRTVSTTRGMLSALTNVNQETYRP